VATLATPAELAVYLQTATEAEYTAGNPDVLDTARATLLLENASGDIRSACGWSITQETVTGERVYPGSSGYIRLPTLRLTAFTMTINAVPAVDGTDYTWTLNGGIVRVARSFLWSDAVLVTYTHGYATAPADLKAVCLEHAAAAYANPPRYRSEHIEGVVTVYGGPDLETDPRVGRYRLAGVA
jgi:hypothetical protein